MGDMDQARSHSSRGSVATEPAGMDDLWNIVFSQDQRQQGLRRVSVRVPLEDIEHEPVLVHGPPQPVVGSANLDAPLVGRPLGTPPLCPVTQAFDEKGAELDAPLAEGLVAGLR
ncbi:hypothetical protein GCM10008949_39860 [Deinococcus humi]|nr:hypothetical protein GCM10008949_39860 [Deinococcus humi]